MLYVYTIALVCCVVAATIYTFIRGDDFDIDDGYVVGVLVGVLPLIFLGAYAFVFWYLVR